MVHLCEEHRCILCWDGFMHRGEAIICIKQFMPNSPQVVNLFPLPCFNAKLSSLAKWACSPVQQSNEHVVYTAAANSMHRETCKCEPLHLHPSGCVQTGQWRSRNCPVLLLPLDPPSLQTEWCKAGRTSGRRLQPMKESCIQSKAEDIATQSICLTSARSCCEAAKSLADSPAIDGNSLRSNLSPIR